MEVWEVDGILINEGPIVKIRGDTYSDDPTMHDLLSWAVALDSLSDRRTPRWG